MDKPEGQVSLFHEFGKTLRQLSSDPAVQVIVEIGTWKGGGSTYCIYEGIKGLGKVFLTFETHSAFFKTASDYYADKPEVTCVYGRILSDKDLTDFKPTIEKPQHKGFWEADFADYKNCADVSDRLPEFIDLLVLDGGEFTTGLEWLKLKDRAQIVALDDILCLKTRAIYQECLQSDQWELFENGIERNGYAIFKRKNK